MPTIREVAELSGVSASTVSRVINGSANVTPSKKERVMAAIQKTGYEPNELARALYKQSSNMIGLIVPDIVNPFFSELSRVIEEVAHENGYTILLCNSNNDAEKEAQNVNLLKRMKADGIILITNNDGTGEIIKNCTLPVVVVDRHVENGGELARIESDHYSGGRLATLCLIDKGCRQIVCMRGPQAFASGRLRYEGYRDVCEEHHRSVCYVDCEYNYNSGEIAARELLQRYPEADGIVAANDMVALSTYKVVHECGKRVPEDIRIVGFDDIQLSELVTPAITTVHQPIKEMGQCAVDIICRSVRGEAYEKDNVFQVQLIERDTTA